MWGVLNISPERMGCASRQTNWPSRATHVFQFSLLALNVLVILCNIKLFAQAGPGESGTGPTTPSVTQAMVQAVGTSSTANRPAGERIVDATWNWHRTPPDDLTTPGRKTIHLSPCPRGLDTSNNANAPYYAYISGTGAAEAVLVTGPKNGCPAGASSGTIVVTTAYSHTAGYAVGSASTGIQEAINDAEVNGETLPAANWRVKFQPTNPPASTYYAVFAPITVASPIADIDGSGASIDVETPSFAFYFPSESSSGETVIHGFRVGTRTTMPGAMVTKVACSSNVSTITSTLHPVVGTYVDIQYTDNTHFWGVHGPVVSSAASSFTLTDNQCGWAARPGAGTIASSASLGNVAPAHAFILDNGQNLRVSEIYFHNPGWASGKFLNNGIIVWNDQAFHGENIVAGRAFNCGANYCGQAIYAPGGVVGGGSMAAVGWLRGLNLSMQCGGNGINWLSGNSINVTDAVIQGQAQFALQVGNMRGNYAGAASTNIYGETSSGCTNPFYSAVGLSGAAAASQAGIRSLGNDIFLGPQPVGPTGLLPNFAVGGAKGYAYYLVIHDGANISAPIRFGIATPRPGSFVIAWPRYASQTGSTVVYDVLKVPNQSLGYFGVPILNGTNQAIALAANVTQCSSLICTLTDTGGPLSSYAPSASIVGLDPYLWNWPGHIVLSKGGHQYGNNVFGGLGTITTRPDYQTVFAVNCSQDSPNVYVSCPVSDNGGSGHPAGSFILNNSTNFAGGTTNLKGRLIFGTAYTTTPVVGHIITLFDSCPSCTLADPFHRPANNANDAYVGLDSVTSLTKYGLSLGAGSSISSYIGNIGDNSSYLERLTSSKKVFTVPVGLGKPQTFSKLSSQMPCNPNNEGITNPVTDSSTEDWGATITGGSSHHVLAYCDGTNWTVAAK